MPDPRPEQTRPPHPPSAGGRLADLMRRGRLTLRYHGPRELVFRLVTFPLRGTRFATRVGHGRRYGPETARARHWYSENGRPVTVVVHSSGGLVPRSVRRTTRRRLTRVATVDGGVPDAVCHASAVDHDVVLLRGAAEVERGWLERLQYGPYQSDEVGATGPKLVDREVRVVS